MKNLKGSPRTKQEFLSMKYTLELFTVSKQQLSICCLKHNKSRFKTNKEQNLKHYCKQKSCNYSVSDSNSDFYSSSMTDSNSDSESNSVFMKLGIFAFFILYLHASK